MSVLSDMIDSTGIDFTGRPGTTTESTFDTMSPEMKALIANISGQVGSAGFNPGALSLSGLENFVSGLGNNQLDAKAAAAASAQAFKDQEQALLRDFEENVAPQVNRSFSQSGRFSSDFLKSKRDATRELGTNLAQIKSGFLREDLQNQRNLRTTQQGMQLQGLQSILGGQRSQQDIALGGLGILQGLVGSDLENVVTTTDPTEGLIGGVASGFAAGYGNSYSDKRMKKDIEPLAEALGKVQALSGVTWDWDEGVAKDLTAEGRRGGIIAQDLQSVMPELVKETKSGHLMVDYQGVTGMLVEAVKDLADQMTAIQEAT